MTQIAESRVLAARAATLTFQFRDQNDEPSTAPTVTVGVTSSDGTEVLAPGTATTVDPKDASTVTVQVTSAQIPEVDQLQATWADTTVTLATTFHDVVGGAFMTTAEARQNSSALKDEAKVSTDDLIRDRRTTETKFETWCGRAFVPRLSVIDVNHPGGSQLRLPTPDLRSVVWAEWWNGSSWTRYVLPTNPPIPDDPYGVAFWTGWIAGRNRIGYRHGTIRPPEDVKRAAITYLEHRYNMPRTAIDERAQRVQTEGATIDLIVEGTRRGSHVQFTGIPSVDRVLNDHRWQPALIA